MAKSLTSVFRNNVFASNYFNNFVKCGAPVIVPVRQLYSRKTLGIETFEQTRSIIYSQFANLSEKFRTKMNEYVESKDTKTMIFTEDLKNMLHLAESSDSDMNLVVQMMKKFNQQNKELRFGSFVFGPVVMRMFYFLNEPDLALECFKAPELEGFFDQLMSYQLLLDLLFENDKFEEVIQTFNIIKNKQIQGTKYPKNIVVLTMAACYKQNTAESAKYALELWQELHDVGHLPMRRAVTFCAALALNQGNPQAAHEIVSSVKKQNYVTVRNIKAAALADIGRIEDVLFVLRYVLDIDDPNDVKHTFCQEVIDRCRNSVEKNGSPDEKKEFQRIDKYLVEQGHVAKFNLDFHLCSTIITPPVVNYRNRETQTISRNQYQGDRSKNYRVFNQRPGLKDMN